MFICLQYVDKQNQRKTITTKYLGDKCFIDKIPFIGGLSIFVSLLTNGMIILLFVDIFVVILKTGLLENDFSIDDDWNIGINIKRHKVL